MSTGALSELSRRALTSAVGRVDEGEPVSSAMVRPLLQLRESLLTLIGTKGYRALVERALHLAAARYRWMATLEVDEEGAIAVDRVAAVLGEEGAANVLEGMIALVDRLIELLCLLIGEELTLRLARRAWSSEDQDPDLSGRTGAGP